MREGIAYGEIQTMTAEERTQTLGAIAAISEIEQRQQEEARWFQSVQQQSAQNAAQSSRGGGMFLGE